ncbi:DUF397 domain-containing protein [Dactylosporangium sp. CS-033363]|uniref:DUF397 domain-containing protein n=1 Tax=Dactylosporangium sp. CS-033363 TaxID=3239935 RepID=UPI003D8D04A8
MNIADNTLAQTWRTSSRSASGNCVEVLLGSTEIHVRDSKNRAVAELGFTASAWTAFVTAVSNEGLTER